MIGKDLGIELKCWSACLAGARPLIPSNPLPSMTGKISSFLGDSALISEFLNILF